MEWMAKYLVAGDVVTIERKKYEVLDIQNHIGVTLGKIRHMTSGEIKDVIFQPSEFVNVRKDSHKIERAKF